MTSHCKFLAFLLMICIVFTGCSKVKDKGTVTENHLKAYFTEINYQSDRMEVVSAEPVEDGYLVTLAADSSGDSIRTSYPGSRITTTITAEQYDNWINGMPVFDANFRVIAVLYEDPNEEDMSYLYTEITDLPVADAVRKVIGTDNYIAVFRNDEAKEFAEKWEMELLEL